MTPPQATARNGAIDYGRFVAALGIVWFHSQAPGFRLAYMALPFFLVLLAMPSRAPLVQRGRRLLQPWLIWSLVYAVLQVAMSAVYHEPAFGWWHWYMLLTGTALHLWFLPFAFAIAVVTPFLQRGHRAAFAAVGVAGLLCLFGTPETIPLAQYCFGLIPVLIGIAYFASGWRMAWASLIAAVALLFIWRPSSDNMTILLGTGIALAVLSVWAPSTKLSQRCADLSMWIYLSHPVALVAVGMTGLSGALYGAAALIVTLGLTLGLARIANGPLLSPTTRT